MVGKLWFRGSWLILLSAPAQKALAASSTRLPWDTPLRQLQESISGPVALAISLIAIVITGWSLIAGGEMGDFAKRAIMTIFAIALLVGGSNLMSNLFGIQGALL